MGFKGIDGKQVGTQMMIYPGSQRKGSAWYSVNTEVKPFYYFSPAYLYRSPLILKKDAEFRLKYRILHLPGEAEVKGLNNELKKYIK